ncbi:DUF4175 family protein [Flavobacterium sp.]|uniref:coiled-coil domain-containing protein n=1 Tax=Flavobacterium sp. TaxID=239 RepID=UPI003D6C4B94
MENSKIIFQKLEGFIRKFYTNELLRGTIFFVGLGLIYLLATSFIEYFLWLKPVGRTFLFWLFICVEVFLLIRFIAFPVFKLFKVQKGIDFNDASRIIGSHFSEVSDKLTNFLQLSKDDNHSELLLASIEQKANSLQPIPFTNAIDFKKNKKFLPLAIIPLLVFLFLILSGREQFITESMNRVVHYKEQFLPPAPFSFVVTNNLQTEQNKDFVLKVKTIGSVVPEKAMIFIDDESYFMENNKQGEFQFVFEKPLQNVDFHIEANEISSEDYTLNVVTVPAISNFIMTLNFPNYLNKKSELIKGTGNAIVPEGTQITWKISTIATSGISLIHDKASFSFQNSGNEFKLTKNILQNTDYQIFTSNKSVKNYEKLNYSINIIKDQYPTIKATTAPDSLKVGKNYILGQISDDYGFSKLQIVYFPKDKPEDAKRETIAVKQDVFGQFVFSFPSNLPIVVGVPYDYYFEVFDNDAPHNFKSSKSSVFSHRESTLEEKQEENLQQQNNNINSLQKSLNAQDKQMSELEKLKNNNKEKSSLDYKEQQKINDFIKRQKQQEDLMKEFSEKIKDNLEQFKSNEKDPEKELLKERLEKADKELEKNQKLLDELKELNEKLNQEELFDKIEKFQQKSKNQTKNLEQLVELTKRYYVEKKAEQIADKLEKLSEKQDALADDKKENSTEKQNEINKEFDKIQEELKELDKENKELKSPMDIPQDKEKQESIDKDMQNASDELKKNQKEKASPKQKSAAKKMMQMSQSMQSEMEGGEQEQMEEDVKMLRQILDNLLEFSFSQEGLIKNFKSMSSVSSASFTKYLKTQQDLKTQFKHVDDSLFAMSLRNPKISEQVTSEIGKVYYNIDKSIENFTENQLGRGTASQQFSLTSANNLANLLSDILNGMQMSLAGMAGGKPKPGQGQGMQLPDIIKKQEGLAKKMGEGKPKQGNDGKQGEKGEKGDKPGDKKGSKPGSGGEGSDGEGDAKQVLDILKEQQQLRDALEKELQKNGLGGSGQNALNQMKQIEKQLINKGFTNDVIQKALNLKYELLKLEKAMQEQNQDTKRQSNTNKTQFNNSASPLPQKLQDYLNSIEILNRQTLPLRSNFNRKVQEYFRENDKL